MALKEMLPYRDEIISMKEPPNVKTHDDVITFLDKEYNLKVSKPTVTRFLQKHAPHLVNSRALTPEEEKAVVPFEAFLRVEAEIVAMREELGIQIDTLTEKTAGKLAVLSADIVELEKAITPASASQNETNAHVANNSTAISPQILRKIWFRAFMISFVMCVVLFTSAWLWLKP